jgi:hypothetical protein
MSIILHWFNELLRHRSIVEQCIRDKAKNFKFTTRQCHGQVATQITGGCMYSK